MDTQATLVEYTVDCLKLKVELTSQRAYWDGKLLKMGPKSFLFLHTLAFRLHKREDPIVRQVELLRVLYGESSDTWPVSNTLQVFLNRLRNALAKVDANIEIETVRGKGYQLILPPE